MTTVDVRNSNLLGGQGYPFEFITNETNGAKARLQVGRVIAPPRGTTVAGAGHRSEGYPEGFPTKAPGGLTVIVPVVVVTATRILFPFSTGQLTAVRPAPGWTPYNGPSAGQTRGPVRWSTSETVDEFPTAGDPAGTDGVMHDNRLLTAAAAGNTPARAPGTWTRVE